MKLALLCVHCLVSIAYALIPNQASAFELSLECDYLGPVINATPDSGLVCELTWNPSSNFFADYADYRGFVQYVPGIGNPNATDHFQRLRFPLVGTAQPRIVYLKCTSFNGLHRIFMTADASTREFVDSGGRYVFYHEHSRNHEAEGSIVAFPCGSRPVGTGP